MNPETPKESLDERYMVIPEENQYTYKTEYLGDHKGLEACVRSRKPKGTTTHAKMIEEFMFYQKVAEKNKGRARPTEKLEMQLNVNEDGGVMFATVIPIYEIGVS